MAAALAPRVLGSCSTKSTLFVEFWNDPLRFVFHLSRSLLSSYQCGILRQKVCFLLYSGIRKHPAEGAPQEDRPKRSSVVALRRQAAVDGQSWLLPSAPSPEKPVLGVGCCRRDLLVEPREPSGPVLGPSPPPPPEPLRVQKSRRRREGTQRCSERESSIPTSVNESSAVTLAYSAPEYS